MEPTEFRGPESVYTLSGVSIEKQRAVFNDNETTDDEQQTSTKGADITTVLVPPTYKTSILVDPDLVEDGMTPVTGTKLVDFKKTEVSLGKVPGILPEYFLANEPDGILGICPTNFGWQEGCVIIRNEKMITLRNDRNMTGELDLFVQRQDTGLWEVRHIWIDNGQVPVAQDGSSPLDGVAVGFSMPKILEGGKIISLEANMHDPRLLADFRNIWDFSFGKKVPADFWVLIKSFLPRTQKDGKRLLAKKNVQVMLPNGSDGLLDPEQFARLQDIINSAGLQDSLLLEQLPRSGRLRRLVQRKNIRNGGQRLVVNGTKLPFNRIPIVGIGIKKDGSLMITVADGRREDSPGLTIYELADIMR